MPVEVEDGSGLSYPTPEAEREALRERAVAARTRADAQEIRRLLWDIRTFEEAHPPPSAADTLEQETHILSRILDNLEHPRRQP